MSCGCKTSDADAQRKSDEVLDHVGLREIVGMAVILLAVLAPWVSPQDPYDLGQIDIMDGRLEPGAVGGGPGEKELDIF